MYTTKCDGYSSNNKNLVDNYKDINKEDNNEEKLLQTGKIVGIFSLEWALNFLTQNSEFLREKPMSPLSIFAAHIWTGSQKCDFSELISPGGKLRNDVFKLLIHPVHELVSSLRSNEYYFKALKILNPNIGELPFITTGIDIPLITGNCFNDEYIEKLTKWIKDTSVKEIEDKTITNFIEHLNNRDIYNNDELIYQISIHWLIHKLLSNFLYNPNGPISISKTNILIDKLLPLDNFQDGNKICCRLDIFKFSKSLRNIWKSIKGKYNEGYNEEYNGNFLELFSDSDNDFVECLVNIIKSYPLEDLLTSLVNFVTKFNNILHISNPWRNVYSFKDSLNNIENDDFIVDIDPKEPFNVIFELSGHYRAITICREYYDNLKPKSKYNRELINSARLILTFCLEKGLSSKHYIEEIPEFITSKNITSSFEENLFDEINMENTIDINNNEILLENKELTSKVNNNELLENKELRSKSKLYSNDTNGRKISVEGISDILSSDSEPIIQNISKTRNSRKSSNSDIGGNPARKYRRWTDDETSLLVDGVNEYGIGKWRVILANSKLCRDEVGLKDRWRNLIKGSHVKWNSLSKKYYIVD
ncbi:MYB-like DNA-binding domain-containing protein [Cryptosporidium andersoni]|uniref:MYB-like DNA-binding domain-containing protein n=1 Tax=Cryptosporidium andersoni TaxID=117008 RepID=A0A1J4MHZ7_9CRYT|nr:MYB-like DNA-binding domain-containing protein [Cryptosporidium andersoni]